MKKLVAIVSVVAVFAMVITGCSKEKIEQKYEDLVVQVMTDGQWVVSKFTEAGADSTAVFAGWECQFYDNKTCQAKLGTTTVSGTWDGSASAQTITGQFPASHVPLAKMNGVWKIVRTTYTFGEFSQTKNGIDYKMELTKK